MNLARETAAIEPRARPSPLPGFEYVRGWGVYALPLDTGHVLALRVFPENDFAPYRTIWHRSPEGDWSIYADSPRLDIACPRYYDSASRRNEHANISLRWTGPMDLSIEMEIPRLTWNLSMTTTGPLTVMNGISRSLPESLWRTPFVLRAFERLGRKFFDMGDVTLSGNAPNGHFAIVMPRRMFPVASATVRLEGEDLGRPARFERNPSIGRLRLPARPIFAVGRAYFEMRDPEEYRRTVAALGSDAAVDRGT